MGDVISDLLLTDPQLQSVPDDIHATYANPVPTTVVLSLPNGRPAVSKAVSHSQSGRQAGRQA